MDVSSVSRLTPQMVTAAVRNTADNDGDGKTGAAALNDGDAAAHAAARQVKATSAPAAAAHAAPAARPAVAQPAAQPPQASSHVDTKA
jgi:hypothetical protein